MLLHVLKGESTESGPIEIDHDKIPVGHGSSPIPENETSKTWCNQTRKFPRFKFMSLNIFSLLPHLDESPFTIIGHIITNMLDVISSSGVRPCGISDHDALFFIRNTRAPKLKAPPKVVTVRKYKRFNMVDF